MIFCGLLAVTGVFLLAGGMATDSGNAMQSGFIALCIAGAVAELKDDIYRRGGK